MNKLDGGHVICQYIYHGNVYSDSIEAVVGTNDTLGRNRALSWSTFKCVIDFAFALAERRHPGVAKMGGVDSSSPGLFGAVGKSFFGGRQINSEYLCRNTK